MWKDLWDHEVRNEYASKEAIVKNCRCRRIKGKFYPALIKLMGESREQDIVEGRVYLDVNNEDYERIRSYHGKEFDAIDSVCFTTDSELPQAAIVFVWKPEYKMFLSSEDWTKEWFEEHALSNFRKDAQSLF
jgi:hypothetical protein